MLGLNPNPPKFVRQYANLGPDIEAAVKAYAADVRDAPLSRARKTSTP